MAYMTSFLGTSSVPWRRLTPRVEVAALCSELADEGEDRYGCIMDLSPMGLRIERPFAGPARQRRIQVEAHEGGHGAIRES